MAVKRWSIIDEQYPTPWKRRDFLLLLFLLAIDCSIDHRMRWSLRSLCIYVRVHMPCTRKINSRSLASALACLCICTNTFCHTWLTNAWIGLMIRRALQNYHDVERARKYGKSILSNTVVYVYNDEVQRRCMAQREREREEKRERA